MNYWTWMKSKWKTLVDWVLLNYGWYVDTIHSLSVHDSMFFRQGDPYRVANNDNDFLIIYVMKNNKLICAKANKFGEFILWCRDVNYKRQRWLDGL